MLEVDSPYSPDAVQLCGWLCAGADDDRPQLTAAAAGDAVPQASGALIGALYDSEDDFDRALAKLLEGPAAAGDVEG